MSSQSPTLQLVSRTRFDVTDCDTDRLTERARANDVADAELYLERRGGKTYLVADPVEAQCS